MNWLKRALWCWLILTAWVVAASAQDSTLTLLGDFKKGWDRDWLVRKLPRKPTVFQVVSEDTNQVLRATSSSSAAALWRMLNIRTVDGGSISWRWKIERPLSKKTAERTKLGDDYAARLYLVFEPHLVSWKTHALCYVWAAKQSVGSVYTDPYGKSVKIIVLESGGEKKGKWVSEQRDFLEDYQKAFGKDPEMITAVALMVDTDNSHQEATAWFDDIVLKLHPPKLESQNLLLRPEADPKR
ncbi:MAG: DUF3047 domain-containing protein [Calditrichaeota bacterium]|nr:MAG: DUF3047 domain-containing protein [Calditrichota bacterium]